MAKRTQKQFKTGTTYQIKGPSGKRRNLVFAGDIVFDGKKGFVFKMLRKSPVRHRD